MSEPSAAEIDRIISAAAQAYGIEYDTAMRWRILEAFEKTGFPFSAIEDFADGWMYAQWLMSQPAGKELADDE